MPLSSVPIFPRRFWIILIALCLAVASGVSLTMRLPLAPPIRIGVLHSLSGTMANNESPLVDAIRLAVEEINAAGGLLGQQLVMVVVDGQSDERVFAAEAARLIEQEQVSVLFACWTSSCRQAVKPVVEQRRHLMFYPIQYEGLEQSPNIVYTGSVPNQQIIPGTTWALETLGNRVYLLGSQYAFPHTVNVIIRDVVTAKGGRVLAERYQPLGASDFSAVVDELRTLKPDVVLNTINGDSNLHLFRALHEAGLGALPVVSFSISEVGMQLIGAQAFHPNHYAVWNYFQSLPTDVNRRFVAAFQARYGPERVISAPMEAAYVGVRLWAQAVRDSGTAEPQAVNLVIGHQSLAAPSGIVAIDAATRHLWQQARIGKARPDGQFEVLWSSEETLRPWPFPAYRPLAEWRELLEDLSGVNP